MKNKQSIYFILFFIFLFVGVFIMVPSGICVGRSLVFTGSFPPSVHSPLFLIGTILCALAGMFGALFDKNADETNTESEFNSMVIDTPSSGTTRKIHRTYSKRNLYQMTENEQKQSLELVQNTLQDALAHCPQGTGKTKSLILSIIDADMRQAKLDEVCEKIADNLSETIKTEW